MRTDIGYVVLRRTADRGLVVEVCAARDANGVGVNPHAVHTGATNAEIADESVFVTEGSTRYSTEPLGVSASPKGGVQIVSYAGVPESDDFQPLC